MPPEDKTPEIRLTVSRSLYQYLNWLAENTVLGKSANDVARQILTERLAAMRNESYVDQKGQED